MRELRSNLLLLLMALLSILLAWLLLPYLADIFP